MLIMPLVQEKRRRNKLQSLTREELFKGISIILNVGSGIYLGLFAVWLGLAIYNGQWTYTADSLAPIEWFMLIIFCAFQFYNAIMKVISLL